MRLLRHLAFFGVSILLQIVIAEDVNISKSHTNITALVDKVVQELETATDCTSTLSKRIVLWIPAKHFQQDGVLTTLKSVANLGDKVFDNVLTQVCILSGAEDDDVCKGTIDSEGPILAYDLRQMIIPSHTSTLLCSNLLGLCDYPAVRPYTVQLQKPKKVRKRPQPSKKNPINVVHFSDTHVDLDYTTGSNYNCTKPICCRPYTPQDAPGNTSTPCGPYGNTKCDPPLRLEESMFSAINDFIPDAAFSIFTGDVPAHDIWLVDRKEVTHDLSVTYNHMSSLKSQVFAAVGNHDTAPVNAFPPSNLPIYSTANPQWSYNKLSSEWSQWIGATEAQEADKYGSYSKLMSGTKLRIISFNSIFYYVLNFWMYSTPMSHDPDGQLEWLAKELQAAETAGERVWLIAHVPSGSSDFFQDYSNYFNQVIQRYSNTISACFYGHTHTDSFEIAYKDYSKPSAGNANIASYVTPSMTPTSGSPAFRVYSVDPDTFAVLDFTQYIADISSPSYQKNPKWTKYYSAKEVYGSLLSPPDTSKHSEMTGAFWHKVTEAFEKDNKAFQQYYARKTRGFDVAHCNATCKSGEIKMLRAANSEYNGVVPTPGLHFSKRDLDEKKEDECGEGKMRGMFRRITAMGAD